MLSGFTEVMFAGNWLSSWVNQENVQYDWKTAGSVQTYVARFST
jgi:hypothetical protein